MTIVAEHARFMNVPGHHARGVPTAQPAGRRRPRLGVLKTLRGIWSSSPRALRGVFLLLVGLIALSVFVFQFFMKLSLVDAFYFIVTTVTTTGYGDISTKDAGTALKLYSCAVMLLGSVTMAILYSFATDFVVSERVRTALGRMPTTAEGHVVVVGIGNVGLRTLDALEGHGVEVVAVDREADGAFAAAVRTRCPFIAGDARQAATLGAAGVERALAVVTATGDDAVNLAVCLEARRLAPKVRTVARLFDADFASKVQSSGLVDVALSPSRIAAPSFVAAALFPDALAGFAEKDALMVLRAATVPRAWDGRTPRDVSEAESVEVLLVADRSDAEHRPAAQDERLRRGQRALVAERIGYARGRSG
jgi:Trk K+ transport system NAD-binding subunit